MSVEFRPRRMVAELAPGAVHQGIVAIAGRYRYATLDDLLAAAKQAGQPALLVLLDGITDPPQPGRDRAQRRGAGRARRGRSGARLGLGDPGRGEGVGGRHRAGGDRRGPQPAQGNRRLREGGVRVLGAGAGEGDRLDKVDLKQPDRRWWWAPRASGMREAVARRCDGLFHVPQRGEVSRSTPPSPPPSPSTRPPASAGGKLSGETRNAASPKTREMGMVMTKLTLWNNTDLDMVQRGLHEARGSTLDRTGGPGRHGRHAARHPDRRLPPARAAGGRTVPVLLADGTDRDMTYMRACTSASWGVT